MSSEPATTPRDGQPGLRLLFVCALLAVGFGYIAMVLCGRPTPFASRDTPWNDWLGVMLSGPALYLFGTRHTLVEFTTPLGRSLRWNLCGFTLPFFVALHWEYVGQCTGANFSLTARQLSHLNRPGQIALATGILIAAAITGLCMREARKAGFLRRYLACFGGLIATLVAITAILGPHYYVHIHHYFWSLCLIPFVRFRNLICLVTQGALVGIYVEGAARYGLAPIWIFHR